VAVMAREAWTDERLDDLKGQVEKGFGEVKGEIREVKGEIRDLRVEIGAMQRTMIIGFVTLFASIFASVIGGVIAAMTLT
jgi:hypothetical protein